MKTQLEAPNLTPLFAVILRADARCLQFVWREPQIPR